MNDRAPENPFRPGRGTPPPVLAGRDAELAAAERFLTALDRGNPPSQDILFFGPRGNGKTVLLLRIAELAGARGFRVERLPVAAFSGEERLARELQRRSGEAAARLTGIQVAGTGFSAEPGPPSADVSELLARWIGATPLVVVLDEVHAVAPAAGREFFDAVQDAKGASLPFLLLAAGTPDAPRRLRQLGTHNERGFDRFRIGRLRHEDARAALAEPAAANGRPMATEALALLADESQDYPYFIQLLGSAAWDSAQRRGDREIGRASAEAGAEAARRTIGDFYGERFREAKGAGVHRALYPLAAAFRKSSGTLREDEFDRLLEDVAGGTNPLALLDTLEDLGVVWETRTGVWEMGIPSFADHVLRRREADIGDRLGPATSA